MLKNKINFLTIIGASILLTIFPNNVTFAQIGLAPDPIKDLIAIPDDGQIHLSWTAPNDNGLPISSYTVIRWETGSEVFTTFPNLSPITETISTGLKNGVSYSFKVMAVNSAGTGKDSDIASAKPMESAPKMDIPNAITDLVATRGDGKMNLSWTKPNDNGLPITSYKITYWIIGTDDFKKITVSGEEISTEITGLKNDASYYFKINSINDIGQSPDSNIDSAIPSKSTSITVPDQVRGIVSIPSNEQVFLTWIEPPDNGAPITSYRITVNEKGSNISTTYTNFGDSERATISGLKNEILYEFKIAAVNVVGIGKDSIKVSATPNNRVPIEITNLKAIPGDGSVSLSWSVSPAALESITGYRIREYKSGSDSFVTHSIIGKSTDVTIDGLTNGVPYGFRVLGVNTEGIGPDSYTIYVIPLPPSKISNKAPAQINNLEAIVGDSQVKLLWSTPGNGGFPITGYQIIQSVTGSSTFTTIPKLNNLNEAIITGLTNNVSYDFRIAGINQEGIGKLSKIISVIPQPSIVPKYIIPQWIKTNAGWWSEGKISDIEYVQAIEYLINQKIIKIK